MLDDGGDVLVIPRLLRLRLRLKVHLSSSPLPPSHRASEEGHSPRWRWRTRGPSSPCRVSCGCGSGRRRGAGPGWVVPGGGRRAVAEGRAGRWGQSGRGWSRWAAAADSPSRRRATGSYLSTLDAGALRQEDGMGGLTGLRPAVDAAAAAARGVAGGLGPCRGPHLVRHHPSVEGGTRVPLLVCSIPAHIEAAEAEGREESFVHLYLELRPTMQRQAATRMMMRSEMSPRMTRNHHLR